MVTKRCSPTGAKGGTARVEWLTTVKPVELAWANKVCRAWFGALAGLMLLGGCVSQSVSPPPTAVVLAEDTALGYGACSVISGVDQFTDEIVQHVMFCGIEADESLRGAQGSVVVTCWDDQMAATLMPARGTRIRDRIEMRYRADKTDEQHDEGGWQATSGGGAITFDAETIEQLLVTLADTTDEFLFQIMGVQVFSGLVSKEYSHTVKLTDTDTKDAVFDLRARCS